jgi:hypothetical protein
MSPGVLLLDSVFLSPKLLVEYLEACHPTCMIAPQIGELYQVEHGEVRTQPLKMAISVSVATSGSDVGFADPSMRMAPVGSDSSFSSVQYQSPNYDRDW